MTDRNLFLILRIIQNRTGLPFIVWEPQYIWHRQNNNGKSQITYECSADTLAGPCLTPRASARKRGQCAFAHAEASIESIAYTPHVIPGPSIPLSSLEDVSRTSKLFPLPLCCPMIRGEHTSAQSFSNDIITYKSWECCKQFGNKKTTKHSCFGSLT